MKPLRCVGGFEVQNESWNYMDTVYMFPLNILTHLWPWSGDKLVVTCPVSNQIWGDRSSWPCEKRWDKGEHQESAPFARLTMSLTWGLQESKATNSSCPCLRTQPWAFLPGPRCSHIVRLLWLTCVRRKRYAHICSAETREAMCWEQCQSSVDLDPGLWCGAALENGVLTTAVTSPVFWGLLLGVWVGTPRKYDTWKCPLWVPQDW